MEKKLSILKNRSVIKFTGKDVVIFLNNILTCDINRIAINEVIPSALLSPQGKILFDLIVFKSEKNTMENIEIFIECSKNQKDELIKKLQLYKLRQEVKIEETNLIASVTNQSNLNIISKLDKRFKDNNILRAYYLKEELSEKDHVNFAKDLDWYYLKKFLNCVPEGDEEIPSNNIFPFEINTIIQKGVNFDKGCFIGQEVIARVKYKGNVKKRYFAFKCPKCSALDLKINDKIKNDKNIEIGEIISLKKINNEIYGFALIKTKFVNTDNKTTKIFFHDLILDLI